MTELKPCPHCGGEMGVALHDDGRGWYWWTVQRGNDDATACKCRLFMESFQFFEDGDPFEDRFAMRMRDVLIEKWNRRVD